MPDATQRRVEWLKRQVQDCACFVTVYRREVNRGLGLGCAGDRLVTGPEWRRGSGGRLSPEPQGTSAMCPSCLEATS